MRTLEAENLVKTYSGGSEEVAAVRGASLHLDEGELVVLMGPSGSGKTTLLSILGCILSPDEGVLRICGEDVEQTEASLAACRRRHFGFVYQHFNLLSALSVRENVEVPLWMSGRTGGVSEEIADQALAAVSLTHRARFRTAELSGGEKQRTAIARAIAGDAPILLADEPTGNLDSDNGRIVLSMLRNLASGRGKSVLIVTHDERSLRYADRVLRMEDGEVRAA